MPNGIIIIDKPSGWTSMDVCAKLRGIMKEKRVGHGGTLDPMATGVLPVFVGSATKAVEFAEKGDKEYVAGLRLGVVTNTQDVTGEVLSTAPVSAAQEDLEAVLPRFTGPIQQVPPMFSAIKIKGQKLYELARRGQEVERKPRPVTIHALQVLERTGEAEYLIRVRCSKGTYVRTLCHDIGQALGCGGCMSSLRRTMAAGFTLEDAVTLERVQEGGEALLLPVDCFFTGCPVLLLTSPKEERLCRNGNPLPAADMGPGEYRVYAPDGTFLCLSRWEKGQLVSIKNFFGG
ncbi:MAG: tRNA pseudouridine(55) synthase TruB [Oscillospiraceae bacterium]|jgi:tRNA pseudouridine55 synthase|nr:tRNA pseudouridine(55) synthase TruB [Oscillospiraceae bacterium]